MEILGVLFLFLVLWWIVQGFLQVIAFMAAHWTLLAGTIAVLVVLGLLARAIRRRWAARRTDRAAEGPPTPSRPPRRIPSRIRRETDSRIALQPLEYTLDRAACPVCLGPVSSNVVFCRRCGTPHHRDCFRYAGRCSIYACRGRQYRRAPHPSRRRLARVS